MDALIKSAKIISPNSVFHLQTKDILIEKGSIVKIGKNLGGSKNVIKGDHLCVSDGWVDLFSVIREPGNPKGSVNTYTCIKAKSLID